MGALISIIVASIMGAAISLTSGLSASGAPTVHFADKPAVLRVRKGDDSDSVEEISLRTLLQTRCPSLFTEFKPIWWLPKCVFDITSNGFVRLILSTPSGHFQTLYSVLGDFAKTDLVWYSRYVRV